MPRPKRDRSLYQIERIKQRPGYIYRLWSPYQFEVVKEITATDCIPPKSLRALQAQLNSKIVLDRAGAQ